MSDSDPIVTTRPSGEGRVVITGVDMRFGDMVMLIIKVMFASIPAYFILLIFVLILSVVFGGLFAGLMGTGGGAEFTP